MKLTATSTPSLFPVHLPFGVQHRVLSSIQSALEQCCFEFAKRWLPDFIVSEGWEVFEQVELTKWATKLKGKKSIPRMAVSDIDEKTWDRVLLAICELRHTVVHRRPICATDMMSLIDDALALTQMLNDFTRGRWIQEIRGNLKWRVSEIERMKQTLQRQLSSELEIINKKRKELDQREKGVINEIMQVDKANQFSICHNLTIDMFSHEPQQSRLANYPNEPPSKKRKHEGADIPTQEFNRACEFSRVKEYQEDDLCQMKVAQSPYEFGTNPNHLIRSGKNQAAFFQGSPNNLFLPKENPANKNQKDIKNWCQPHKMPADIQQADDFNDTHIDKVGMLFSSSMAVSKTNAFQPQLEEVDRLRTPALSLSRQFIA